MSKSTPITKARKSLLWLLVIIVALTALNFGGVLLAKGSWVPKLALDLEGGTQIILAPKLEKGKTVTRDQLNQAVSIIRQRIDAAGVSESEISTQADKNVVVAIPGPLDDQTRNRIESSAKLELRPVIFAGSPSTETIGSDGKATPKPTPSNRGNLTDVPQVKPTNASDLNWVTPALLAGFEDFSCDKTGALSTNVAPQEKPLITCDNSSKVKYILGPVEVDGKNLSSASFGQTTTQSGASTGEWAINAVFDDKGTKDFAAVSTRLFSLKSPQNQFAFVLDGRVLSAPQMNAVITDGKPQITGQFTQASAKTLSDQLKFGALPLSFDIQSSDSISATLGSAQLSSGLLAGLIGLILVILYSLLQYRTLGLVTVASLAIAALLTYLIIVFLSWRQGYRLSLAGVAGLIVAIGITADSFIVYFERVRDELREGRGFSSAVENGWKRAFRTIMASDAVNFLAASVLFILAIGNVRGFALTLGITTIVDVIVVVLFTHPVLQLLSKRRFFSDGHVLSGLDPRALGAVYKGRAKFETAKSVTNTQKNSSSREAEKRQTIAERKAAQNGKDS